MKTAGTTLIYRDFWENRLVEIYDTGDFRSLYFASRYLQSKMSLSQPHRLVLRYTRDMMSALLLTGEPRRVLLIGLGAGSLVRFLHHHFPRCTIDAVEHSPPVIKLAQGYFRLPVAPEIGVHCCDGLEFLQGGHGARDPYDLILLDAFDELGMSERLYAEPFFRLCAASLSPQGVFSCNLWSGEPGRLPKIATELRQCFGATLTLPVTGRGNVIRHAVLGPIPWATLCRRGQANHTNGQSARLGLDFRAMAAALRHHNLPWFQRLWYLLH